MVLFTILLITAILLVIFVVLAVSIGGSVAIVLFGDVIVCLAIICWIISRIIKNKK